MEDSICAVGCIFWSQLGFLIWVVLVLVSPRTHGIVHLLRSWAMDAAWTGPRSGAARCLCHRVLSRPVESPRNHSSQLPSPGASGREGLWACDFSPVHLVTAFVGTEALAEDSFTHLPSYLLSACCVPGTFQVLRIKQRRRETKFLPPSLPS